MLGEQAVVRTVGARGLALGVEERLEQGDPAVLVGIGAVGRVSGDEVAAELRRVPLERSPGRRDDDAARRRQRRDEVPAGARRVDDSSLPRSAAVISGPGRLRRDSGPSWLP
jgi:hypothetical protein